MLRPACSLSLSRLSFGTLDVVHTPRITFRSLTFPFALALKVFLLETVAVPSIFWFDPEAVRWGAAGVSDCSVSSRVNLVVHLMGLPSAWRASPIVLTQLRARIWPAQISIQGVMYERANDLEVACSDLKARQSN